jgi:demethylmenaquinone methyltransferase/2-methoxy-6-polyprenyl-1,4-benzoquinol methylase
VSSQHERRGTTHFGYSDVPESEKAGLVGQVFQSVARRYDLMNDLMSLGVHRVWKQFAIAHSGVRAGETVLDLAAGTGDLGRKLAGRVGPTGTVIMADINEAMLRQGRSRMMDAGVAGNVHYVQADAERLPFPDNSFSCITIGFGLRNVTRIAAALESMFRVLEPGGRALILEFSHPVVPGLHRLYDLYSFNVLPRLGKWVTDDEASYRYLVESIRRHPDQETLKGMMADAGFVSTRYFNLSGGIVALHKAYKA